VLEEAIRDHLELKRRGGTPAGELAAVEADLLPLPSFGGEGFAGSSRTSTGVSRSRRQDTRQRVRPSTVAGRARGRPRPPRDLPDFAPLSPLPAAAGAPSTAELPALRAPRRPRPSTTPRVAAAVVLVSAVCIAVAAVAGDAGRLVRSHHAASTAAAATAVQARPPSHSHAARGLPMRPTFPFRPSALDRRPGPADALPALWADGLACSIDCRPIGAVDGWPLRPFHRQHAIRAGLNEIRPGSLHEGLDIEARDNQPVYAIQPGYAQIMVPTGPEAHVRIGNYVYWHVKPAVTQGQYVKAYSTVVGRVGPGGFKHIALSEVTASGAWLNPLRPGGRVLSPWRDDDAPVIATPRIQPDGRVLVRAFDPQSFTQRISYETPVLAPAGLGYQVFDRAGVRIVPLRWALRGNRVLPGNDTGILFAPDAKAPGFSCFATKAVCKPDWDYILAGGNAPGLAAFPLTPGRYRLTVYAWDYAGNATARDQWFTVGLDRRFTPAPAPR